MAYSNSSINVLKDESCFIRRGNSLYMFHYSIMMFPGLIYKYLVMMLSQPGALQWDVSVVVSHSTVSVNYMHRKKSTLTRVVLKCKLSLSLVMILLYQGGNFPTPFLFDNTGAFNAMASNDGFTDIHSLCTNTYNGMSQSTRETYIFEIIRSATAGD